MKILVTGAAGFIGFHTVKALLSRGDDVVGFDSVNDYYDPQLKEDRIAHLINHALSTAGAFTFVRDNLANRDAVNATFSAHKFDRVINLAAQAGVRYSLIDPHSYVESNIIGFTNILEACRHHKIAHLTYASTSSVYGANTQLPFAESQTVDHPLQFYAATKRANELMAHAYSNLFALPTTGLRFFSVYGPWGRPDMALFLFTKNIIEGKPIDIFNHGNHTRDFTFVADIVQGVIRSSDQVATPDPDWDSNAPNPETSYAPFRIYNIGNSRPSRLGDYIDAIEDSLGKKAKKNFMPLQPGDVTDAHADASRLIKTVGYDPKTGVREGVQHFVDWYLDYYKPA